MRPQTIRFLSSCSLARSALLATALTLGAPAVVAVEFGALSITAEGATAARAVFHMHPDPNVRNEDHMAIDMVHPAYWRYSSITDDFDGAYEVIKTFGWTTPFFINARTKHIDSIFFNLRFFSITISGSSISKNLTSGIVSRYR